MAKDCKPCGNIQVGGLNGEISGRPPKMVYEYVADAGEVGTLIRDATT
jgi:hypothetical protein